MPLLLPGAYPADPVMTQRWGHRTTLDGELPKAQPRSACSSSVLCKVLLLCRPALLQATLEPSQQFTHTTRFKSNVFIRVSSSLQCRHALLVLIALALIIQPATSLPFIDEHPDHVIFRYQICQPVSMTSRRLIMGQHFDESKMATDISGAQRILRSATDTDNPGCQEEDKTEYQGENPLTSVQLDDDSGNERKEDSDRSSSDAGDISENGNRIQKQARKKEILERRSWLPRSKMLNSHVLHDVKNSTRHRSSIKDHKSVDSSSNSNRTRATNSNPFTRPRRRRSSSPGRTRSGPEKETGETSNSEDSADAKNSDNYSNYKKSSDSLILLEMVASENNKKKLQMLTKRLKQNAKSMGRISPWDCQVVKRIRKMNMGVFPQFVVDGKCAADKCFYNLAPCEPIKTAVKFLQRDPNRCNPLPSTTNSTIYEERWELITQYITLDCKCGRVLTPNSAKSRKKE